MRQRVGNYPGVTVEKKTGHLRHDGQTFELVDLPGTYSLAPRSPDEMVTVDVLLGRRDDAAPPDVVLSIVDASNLERNLYLVSQVLSLGLPTVVALNMVDVARDRQIEIDVAALAEAAGRAGRRRAGQSPRRAWTNCKPRWPRPRQRPSPIARIRFRPRFSNRRANWPTWLNATRARAAAAFSRRAAAAGRRRLSGKRAARTATRPNGAQKLRAARESLAAAGMPVPAVEAMARYDWVARMLDGVVRRPDDHQPHGERPHRRRAHAQALGHARSSSPRWRCCFRRSSCWPSR